MKLIKLRPCQLLLGLVLVFFGCDKAELDSPIAVKPQPLNSKEINILVDNALNFSNYRAHTIIDSMAMDKPNERLYGPQDVESILFFTDKISGEITALVPLDSETSGVTVNVETVTAGVLTLAPLYTSLTHEQKIELSQQILSEDSYRQLKGIVGEILYKQEPIFSEKPEFINQLLKVNSYILKTYFPDLQPEGGRINLGKEDFQSFVSSENGLTVFNQVSSYVFLKFTPNTGGDPVTHTLQPKPINQIEESKVERVSLGLKDDCYKLEINQTDNEVISKNLDQLGQEMASAFLSVILSDFTGNGISSCLIELSGILSLELKSALEEFGNLSRTEILLKTTIIAGDLLVVAVKEKKCNTLFFNTFAVAKVVASATNLYVNLYKAARFTYEVSEASAFAFSLVPSLRIELSKDLQLYEGNLIEACVKVVKDGTLDQDSPAGKELLIKIKLDTISQYADWKKSGFKVSWSLPPLNGELTAASLATDNEGKASVLWTMPNEPNAVVTLSVDLKDKENDHLFGSPLTFQVKIKEEPKDGTFTDPRDGNVYKTVKIGNQTWFAENLLYSGNIPEITSNEAWASNFNTSSSNPGWAYDNLGGKHYNWYAVNTNTLCPSGWRIPTSSDWQILRNFLGGINVAGGKMKSLSGWNPPNTDANNESGFNGMATGYRGTHGDLKLQGFNGYWWSSNVYNGNNGLTTYLSHDNGKLNENYNHKSGGFPCRCLKD